MANKRDEAQMGEDATAVLRIVRAVCFWVGVERFGISIEPFQRGSSTCEPDGWRAKLILYSGAGHDVIQAILCEEISERDPAFGPKDRPWGPNEAIAALRHKIEYKLEEMGM